MEFQTPLGWLKDTAGKHPDRVCLVMADGEVSYGDLWRLVGERASMISTEVAAESIVTIAVRNDMSSVVEIFAVLLAGAVPLPYMNSPPALNSELRSSDAVLLQTSGSTGAPSIVRISSSNIAAAVEASRAAIHNTEADRWLACLPLSHVGGLAVLWRTVEIGASLVLAPFDDALVDLMIRAKPTIASLVPTMVHRLIEKDPSVLSDMRLVLVGGAETSLSLLEEAAQHGVALAPTYGMTETTSQIATAEVLHGMDMPQWPPLAVPLEGFTITIVSDSGEQAPTDTVGRIRVDGPAVSMGYLGHPDRAGPFDTNDLGSLDASGRLTVVGRSDDVIVSGGENVSLPSVVATIRGFNGVVDAVAVGLQDAEWGEVVGAMVEGSVETANLVQAGKASLSPHERPKQWVVVDAIPTLESGKPDFGAIRRAMGSR